MYEAAKEWAFNRRATHWLAAARDQVYGLPHNPVDWFGTAIGSVDIIIGLPIAWLVVGAVVYGRQIEAEAEASGGFLRRTMHGLLGQGFGPLRDGVYLVGRSGLAAVLGFCGMFLLSQTVAVWMFEAERVIIGPRDFGFWVPASGITCRHQQRGAAGGAWCAWWPAPPTVRCGSSPITARPTGVRIPAQRSELTVTRVEQAVTSSV